MVFVELVLTLLLILWLFNQYLKSKPAYQAAKKIPGPYMYPFIGNLLMLVGLNGEQTFTFLRQNALKYKQNVRGYAFGVLHYMVIRANDLEAYQSPEYSHFDTESL